ncbi:uncharacterized protein C8orf88 homolog isoform X1 [Bufo bufo]|uniref:uncharacterized protein C8orf88 homolog isoform X1 n=2 Tax=Bufo bufo TaxID=8384 RepID=UPI001ABEB46C|nr:uncharacterized protein C8orf88 homolog isoform X1 [Bufo bufo]
MSAAVGPISRHHEAAATHRKGCQLLLSSEMEAKRLIGKPLQPARPIRRCVSDNGAVFMVNFQARFSDHCRDSVKDRSNLWRSIEKLHVLEDPVTEKSSGKPAVNNKKDRITYSRDFLMQLSNVSVSKQKPKYLPDLPITLQHPRRIALSNESEKKTECTDLQPALCPGPLRVSSHDERASHCMTRPSMLTPRGG